MKLVDILARELKVWPKGVASIEQSDCSARLFQRNGPSIGRVDTHAEDSKTAVVTRAQWQAAVDALNDIPKFPSDDVDWTGEGLPPVGIEIEAMLPALGSARFWQIAKVVHGPLPESPGEILVFSLENTKPSWVDQFRPIRTPGQIAAEEREGEVNRMVSTVSMLDKGWARKVCVALYDAGYRLQVQP